ncbi:MAG: hypothetical protein AABN33_29160 [Acidobacteriota bacterium]
MVQMMRNFTLLIFALSLGATLACSTATPTNTNTATLAPEKKTKATGTLTADPNPVKVCDGSGVGITRLTWSASGTSVVEVRIGSPDGALFSNTPAAGGSAETGKWVGNGAVIYLQDATGPRNSEYTIAKITINTTNQGCP